MIFAEGEKTEPGYFANWHRLYKERVIIKVAPHQNTTTPYQLVERAIQQRSQDSRDARRGMGDAFDEYWCVFDVDDHPRLEEALALADAEGIQVAVSNPCIELWLILHVRFQSAYLDTDSAEDLAGKLFGCRKVLSPNVLNQLVQEYLVAKTNASRLDKKHEGDGSPPRSNPSSGVWRLVDLIRGNAAAD